MEKYGSHSNQVIHLAERSQFTSLKFCEGALGRLDSRLNLCRRDAPQFSRESLLCVLSDQLKCWNKILIGANECGGQNHFYYSVSASVTMLALASHVVSVLCLSLRPRENRSLPHSQNGFLLESKLN